ncbi:MAG TPA: histidine kinase [Longimicrobiales bacterium]|nr:histidine kinase [Longimicrobiales bacterium]
MTWTRWKFWLALLVAATLVGLLEAAQVYTGSSAMGRPVPLDRAISSTMPSWFVLLALLPGIFYLCRRFPLEAGSLGRSLPVHFLGGVTFAVAHVTISSWLSDFVFYTGAEPMWTFTMNLSRLLTVYFVVELVTYFGIVGAYHAIQYGRTAAAREREATQLALKATRLEASLSRANLDALRMQLNPHFLFNTLNAISVMAMKGERQGVVRMLTLLSDLLRASLENRQQVVSLRQELEFLDRYLEIEQVRFRDRLTVEQDVDPDALNAEVPTLLLQPLVENAIVHGISRTPGPGSIRIEAGIIGGETLELRVLDSGSGFGQGAGGGTGLGIANTRARLEQLYGADHELILGSRPGGGASVTVHIPLRLLSSALVAGPDRGRATA